MDWTGHALYISWSIVSEHMRGRARKERGQRRGRAMLETHPLVFAQVPRVTQMVRRHSAYNAGDLV